ncbi:peptide chain release factor N(5)-glutamine methyltransferase [Desulforamulus ferrireducens]|uniref:Release factor glutamine methyltransferase n=1 Tax=Desulforamulus ferrireducens TaxID=1833852 RepID=A0A1S6J038_9FIRM|nr:peptide chain release factor N(5)-glutamine methyltransferase [Desulforamulus ferrireducens]AQS60393.1 protein-(glutamine-N5) methyltransferase, release factor-specific [Desulforamulus ferrireducens]
MNLRQALTMGRELLKLHNSPSYALDAQILLSKVTGLDRTALLLKEDMILTEEQQRQYKSLLERRAWGEPVAYLTGTKEFMGLEFLVTPAVLIPRPDTELMVETALTFLQTEGEHPLAVDVGTGSGAIAISLAHYVPGLQVYAIDLSAAALEIAQKNATLHRVDQRVKFLQGNLLQPISPDLQGQVSAITANLPYIPSGEIAGLMPDVKDYEPHLALDGGCDGLDLYRLLIPQAYGLLKTGGLLLMEIGPGQGEGAQRLLPTAQWQTEVKLDLAGRERLVIAQKRRA